MKKLTNKEIHEEAERIRREYAYMDNMPLDGWFWEIIRRGENYRRLCEKINKIVGPIPKEESDAIDKQLEIIGISNHLLYKEGEPWILLPAYLEQDWSSVDSDEEYEEIIKVVVREESIPRPDFSYLDILQYLQKTYRNGMLFSLIEGIKPDFEIITPRQIRAHVDYNKDMFYEKTKKEMGVGIITSEEQYVDKVLRIILSMVYAKDADNSILVRIDKSAKMTEVEEYLLPELRKRLKSSKPKIRAFNKWKYYLIAYDLKNLYLNCDYDDLADILNEAFPPAKASFALDSRTLQNYHKQALLLMNGEYKKYLYKISPPPYFIY